MNKQRLIITSIISIFLCATLLVGSTYSIFTSQEIDENTNVYTTGNLNITYDISSSKNIKFTDVTPMSEEEADSLTPYRITVSNNGNVPYMFDVILTDTNSSKENTIDYQYIMTKVGYLEPKALSNCTDNIIKEDIILPVGESVNIDVKIWLSDKVQNTEIGKSFYSKLTIDGLAVYNDNEDIDNSILSLRYMNTSSTNDIRSADYINKIKTASFVDYIDTSNASLNESNEIISWPMSSKGDVVAWLENNGTTDEDGNTYYDLYIGSKEKIYVKSLNGFFKGMSSLESIIFDNLDTSLTNDMRYVFSLCSSLISLNLSSFDTSNVTSMGWMFASCNSLTSLDLSSFDTSSVTSMYQMFLDCSNLTSLDLTSFDTSNVTTMYMMFYSCDKLQYLDISNFDTSNVTSMGWMFAACSSLTSLDLSNFDTSNVIYMNIMFSGCSSLTSLDVSDFDTSNVINMNSMFSGCSSLTSLDLSSFDTSNVTDMGSMFQNCSSLATIYVSNLWDTSSVASSVSMFYNCSSLIGGSETSWNSNYTDATYARVDGGTDSPGYFTLKSV